MMELRPYVLLIPLIAGLAILLNLIHQDNYKFSPQTKSSTLKNNCDSLLKSGRYLDDVSYMPKGWQPDGCVIKTTSPLMLVIWVLVSNQEIEF